MQSTDFVQTYRDVLSWYPEHVNPIHNEGVSWNDASVHFLLCFPSIYQDKSFSQTLTVIRNFILDKCTTVYLDFAYLPTQNDFVYYEQNNQPHFIGIRSLNDPSKFEFVGFSISILHEALSAMVAIETFKRVGYDWQHPKDSDPILFFGGITSPYCMFASCMVDFYYLGDCQLLNKVLKPYSSHNDYINSILPLGNIYHPKSYKVTYSNGFITSNTKLNPNAPDFVTPYYPSHLTDYMYKGLLRADGVNAGTSQIQTSQSCSGAGSCSFCAEGHYQGRYTELSKEDELSLLLESKRYTASDTYKPFAFNTNYLSDYKQRLSNYKRIFPKVNISNMRMQELGLDPDAVSLTLSLSDSPRLQAPIEGYSPRLINNFLNKNLSEQAIDSFMHQAVNNNVMDIKLGLINTGYETDEDYQYLYDFVLHYKQQASSHNSNLPIRVNCTQLVHYPLTPLEFLERKSALQSLHAVKIPEGDWYSKYSSIGLRFNLVTSRYQTFYEQALLDLQQDLFPLLHKHFIKPIKLIRSIRDIDTTDFYNELTHSYDFTHVFSSRDIDNYISPCHRIRTTTFGSYVRRARQLIHDPYTSPDIRCLGTYDNVKVKCYSHDLLHKPYKLYSDCTITNGHITGTPYELIFGCHGCSTNNQIKETVSHRISVGTSPQLPDSPHKTNKYRITVYRKPGYDSLNPTFVSHYVTSQFLRNDTLLQSFHSVAQSSNQWSHEPSVHSYQSGVQTFDIFFFNGVISELVNVAHSLNNSLQSVIILNIREVPLTDTLSKNNYNIYTFDSTIDFDKFVQASYKYDHEIMLPDDPLHAYLWSEHHDERLISPFIKRYGTHTVGGFYIPAQYNPLYFLRSFLKTAFRNPVDDVILSTRFTCQMNVSLQNDTLYNTSTGKPINKSLSDITNFFVSKIYPKI